MLSVGDVEALREGSDASQPSDFDAKEFGRTSKREMWLAPRPATGINTTNRPHPEPSSPRIRGGHSRISGQHDPCLSKARTRG